MKQQITIDELNGNAFIRAVETLRKLFPYYSENWIQTCKDRILDVKYQFDESQAKGTDIFYVERNLRFDGKPQKKKGKGWKHRKVILRHVFHWCSCFFGPWRIKRERKLCSHIGTCLLFRLYFQILEGAI